VKAFKVTVDLDGLAPVPFIIEKASHVAEIIEHDLERPADRITVELVEVTQEELDALPDFEGY
jgi:hypothetical protein